MQKLTSLPLLTDTSFPVDLSHKIAYMLDHEENRTQLAEQAYQEIKLRYNVPVIKEKFGEIFSDIESRADKNDFFG